METDRDTAKRRRLLDKQLTKLFSKVLKDTTFLEKLAASPQEVLQSAGIVLTADELNANLPLAEKGEISGLQVLQVLNATLLSLDKGEKSQRIVSPPPPPPPPPPRWWPSEAALVACLTLGLRLIAARVKANAKKKARVSSKRKAKAGSTRTGRRR